MNIKIKGLSKEYRNVHALSDVDLEIEKGSCFALLGPNGSGKSTLIKCILGLVIPDSGEVEVDGNGYPAGMSAALEKSGYMPQSPDFPENIHVGELIDLFQSLGKKAADNRDSLMREMGIDHFLKKRFSELSQGMKQKVNLLQCFMTDRELYILDEPTASLDPLNAYFLKNKILEARKKGSTILFTSHIMKEVEEMADKLCLLVDGKLILCGSPAYLLEKESAASLEDALVKEWKALEHKY